MPVARLLHNNPDWSLSDLARYAKEQRFVTVPI